MLLTGHVRLQQRRLVGHGTTATRGPFSAFGCQLLTTSPLNAMQQPNLKRTLSSVGRNVSPPPSKRKIVTTATKAAVANFFKPASQKAPDKLIFSTIKDSLIVGHYNRPQDEKRTRPVKIAAFDFDDTLISTNSGNRFARGPSDWKWWNAVVPSNLKSLHEQGYAIFVISNQAAISLNTPTKTTTGDTLSFGNFKAKARAVLSTLDIPITLYAATRHDLYRKPRRGIWEQLCVDYSLNGLDDIDKARSFFVGDAAGRPADVDTGIRKDHACSDRNFALNVGISFFTPEEHFLSSKPRAFVQNFDPLQYVQTMERGCEIVTPTFLKTNDVELVLFCGSPGAGKSTFYWRHLEPQGYVRVNQDILKTRDRCIQSATSALSQGQSVAVDNTNADPETRAAWVTLAKRMNVPIRLIRFTAPLKLCEHNNAVRALNDGLLNPEKRTILPNMAFTGFASRFREPTLNEGFTDITIVDFAFQGGQREKEIWSQYWIG